MQWYPLSVIRLPFTVLTSDGVHRSSRTVNGKRKAITTRWTQKANPTSIIPITQKVFSTNAAKDKPPRKPRPSFLSRQKFLPQTPQKTRIQESPAPHPYHAKSFFHKCRKRQAPKKAPPLIPISSKVSATNAAKDKPPRKSAPHPSSLIYKEPPHGHHPIRLRRDRIE